MNVAWRSAFVMLGAAALTGCGVEITKALPREGLGQQQVEQFDFIASTESLAPLSRSEPKLLRAAARHCGLPNTEIARETIRHGKAYGIFTSRMMQFACPVPERDMK